MDLERLYLDFNATSPLSTSVIDWLKSGEVLFANPASQHSAGKATRKLINEVRTQLHTTFNVSEKEMNLLFHSGATEGISSFAFSFSEWARVQKKELLVCYSKLDHPAVLSLKDRYWGPHVTFLELSMDQKLEYEQDLNLAKIRQLKSENSELIILYHHLWVHNETGIVSELTKLEELKTIPDLFIHVDAVQAPGKIVDWQHLSLGDIFTFSAHKFGSLKGIGFSFFSKKMAFYPLISGGGQQSNLRSGTENVMGIKSLSLAIRDLQRIDVKKNISRREDLESFMKAELGPLGGIVSEKSPHRNSNTIYFYINDLSSDIALALFDLMGLMLSAGSACSSGAAKASVVLTHLGFKQTAQNGLRLSFGYNFSERELAAVKERFRTVVERIRKQKS